MPHEIPNPEALVEAVKKLELTSGLFDEQDGKPEYATDQGEWVETFYIGVEGTLDPLGIQRAINEKSISFNRERVLEKWRYSPAMVSGVANNFTRFMCSGSAVAQGFRATFTVNSHVPAVISLSIRSIAPPLKQLAVSVITGESNREVTAY